MGSATLFPEGKMVFFVEDPVCHICGLGHGGEAWWHGEWGLLGEWKLSSLPQL